MSDRRRDEAELLERCRRGDEAAWATLYRTYAPNVALFLRGAIGRHDVDDLLQRVFLELLSSLGRFRGEAGLATWLQRIAAHMAKKEARSRWRRERKVEALTVDPAGDSVAPGDAAARVAARERLAQVQAALDTLDWRFRTVWVMRELQGLTVEEAAAALDVRPETIRSRHHRARERLKAALRRIERSAARDSKAIHALREHGETSS